MARQGRSIAVVPFLIGCLVVLLMVGCSETRSEAPKEKHGHSGAASEEARCEETRTTKVPSPPEGVYTTNDIPGCPKGGLLSGTDGKDMLYGGDGEDKVHGLGARDVIHAGAGNDLIYGGPGHDVPLEAGKGDDVIYGGPGKDWRLSGAKGDDVIYGGPDVDSGVGGTGEDVIYGGPGDDSWSGGGGEDVIYGGNGNDDLDGAHDHGARDKLYCGEGKDKYSADKQDLVDSSCEDKVRAGFPV